MPITTQWDLRTFTGDELVVADAMLRRLIQYSRISPCDAAESVEVHIAGVRTEIARREMVRSVVRVYGAGRVEESGY